MMELELSRVDYTLVGLTVPNTMKLLPNTNQGSKQIQKVAVADQDGVLQVFSLKKGELQVGFKTLSGPSISRLQLGGTLGTLYDKIFVSSQNEVRGFTKKGKIFLGFDTNLTEPIKSMHVSGSNLLICGKHSYNQFNDCKGSNSYICSDQINDVIALAAERTNKLIPVLACEDRMLRILDRSEVLHSVEVESTPTVLHLNNNDGGERGDELLFGTSDGKIGLIQIRKNAIEKKWIVNNEARKGGILCIHCYDITGDGQLDLLLGRQDGSIEVYSRGDDDLYTQKYSYSCSESISSIQGGIVGNTGYDEIVAATYTGWIFGLTTEVIDKTVGVDTATNKASFNLSQEARQKISRLRLEIEEIEQKVAKEREKYQTATHDKSDALSAIPSISINDKMILRKEDASYSLTLEVQTAIDNILIQSDVPMDLLDVEKNSAVVSYSACDPNSGNFLLATYRCQMNTTRLELKIRTIEGQHGTLQAYITPLIQPKCCQVRRYRIQPLSLHMRCHDFDDKRPHNTLTLRGAFSLSEIHSWVGFCLPEVPEKLPLGEQVELSFVSSFLSTMLHCTYRKGDAEFKSDNISTISILKDVLTKEATNKKIKVDVSCVVNEASIANTLRLINPKLEAQLQLARQVTLLDALKELQSQEDLMESLSKEYRDILNNETKLRDQFQQQPAYLDRLYGMVTDLFIDRHKFKGINVKGKVPELLEIFENYNLDNLLHFFQSQAV